MKAGVKKTDEHSTGVLRKISLDVGSLTPRILRPRLKSETHVSSKYESLDYDVWENDLLIKEEQSKGYQHIIQTNIIRWFLYLLTGLLTGMIAVFIEAAIQNLVTVKIRFLQKCINYCYEESCFYFIFSSWYLAVLVPALMGSLIVIFIEPSAAGSGIPSILSHLNGVRIPRFTNLKVLIVKILSVIGCYEAGLAAGKEGPFIHIGSIVGSLISSMKLRRISCLFDNTFHLNTVQERRDLMAAGCAAGVSAAFGSPVGATLLSLEEGTSFWSVLLMWRIFFCAIVACFSFNTVSNAIYGGSGQHTYKGLFYFGKFNETLVHYDYYEIPVFIGFGVIGGLIGAFFVFVYSKIGVLRMRYISTRFLQVVDIAVACFLTVLFGAFSMYFLRSCTSTDESTHPKYSLEMFCEEGQHNKMSVFWFQTQEAILRIVFHSPPDSFGLITLGMFFIVYFTLFCLTAGLSISVGLFIPNLLVGATWGRMLGLLIRKLFPQLPWTIPAKYALLGAAAQLGGVMRITISLTVVIIEATGTLTFGFPLMLTLFTTKWVGDFFNEGIYEKQINLLGIPLLPADPPPLTSDITARHLMNSKVIAFPYIVSVGHLQTVLTRCSHHGFPVVRELIETHIYNGQMKTFGELRGFIFRCQLITILYTKSFTSPVTSEEIQRMLELFREHESSHISIQDIPLTDAEREIRIDLRPYMNPSPYSVQMVMSFPRIFRLLRSLGLRHVIVVDNKNQVVGMITRKDLAKFRLWRYATTMGLKELRVQ